METTNVTKIALIQMDLMYAPVVLGMSWNLIAGPVKVSDILYCSIRS